MINAGAGGVWPQAAAEMARSEGAPRVLIADDNIGLAELWSFVLEDAGCEVTVVESGGDALAAAASRKFDVAVLDLQMPDLSGLDVYAALRADMPQLEGIIVTGHASMDSAIEAVNRGIYGYLVKPVAGEVVRVMVERALERQRLQAENERMVSQLGALLQVLDTALQSVGLEDAFQRMSETVVAAMRVDEVSLLLLDEDGEIVLTAAYPVLDERQAGARLRPGEGFAGQIFAEKRPQQLQDAQSDPDLRNSYLKQWGIRSLLGLPLLSGGRAIGVLHVGSLQERVFSHAEQRLLEAIAERMALAVEKARLLEEREQQRQELEAAYRRERRIAETLQRSFLPGVRVGLPGIQVAHLYQPALDEAEVGGDFYDIIELPDGRLGLVMGDISGKGLDAAVYTALVKYTLRGYAFQDPDPGRVLNWLNQALGYQAGTETFATLFYGVVDRRAGCLHYVNAGHEAPLLHRARTNTTEALRSNGPLVGVIPDAEYTTAETRFADDDLLLLYTDGASDASRGDSWLGTDGLRALLEKHLQDDPHRMLSAIYQSVLAFAGGGLRDDTAMMLVRALAPDVPASE